MPTTTRKLKPAAATKGHGVRVLVSGTIWEIAAGNNLTRGGAVERGLPARTIMEVADKLQLSKRRLSEDVGLSVRTLDRKLERKQLLSKEESAAIIRVARARELAAKVFSSDEAISNWFTQPDSSLGGQTPLSMLSNEFTAAEVENLLQSMIHGFAA